MDDVVRPVHVVAPSMRVLDLLLQMRQTRQHMALVVDEFALLLSLRDVYWEQEGRVSVDVALAIIGVAGTKRWRLFKPTTAATGRSVGTAGAMSFATNVAAASR